MKKIKKFKINLRSREIIRLLKKTTKIQEINSDIEEKVETESKRYQNFITPAAIYDTIQKDKFPKEVLVSQPENWVAATAYFVTVGEKIENELKNIRDRKDMAGESIAHSIALEGVEQSLNFIGRLIKEEALNEDCETSKSNSIDSNKLFPKMFEIVSGEKIGINLSDKDVLNPIYSSCGIIYWIPIKKGKR